MPYDLTSLPYGQRYNQNGYHWDDSSDEELEEGYRPRSSDNVNPSTFPDPTTVQLDGGKYKSLDGTTYPIPIVTTPPTPPIIINPIPPIFILPVIPNPNGIWDATFVGTTTSYKFLPVTNILNAGGVANDVVKLNPFPQGPGKHTDFMPTNFNLKEWVMLCQPGNVYNFTIPHAKQNTADPTPFSIKIYLAQPRAYGFPFKNHTCVSNNITYTIQTATKPGFGNLATASDQYYYFGPIPCGDSDQNVGDGSKFTATNVTITAAESAVWLYYFQVPYYNNFYPKETRFTDPPYNLPPLTNASKYPVQPTEGNPNTYVNSNTPDAISFPNNATITCNIPTPLNGNQVVPIIVQSTTNQNWYTSGNGTNFNKPSICMNILSAQALNTLHPGVNLVWRGGTLDNIAYSVITNEPSIKI